MGQLKQIYIDLSQYANDNNGYYPDDLEKFVESCGLYNFSCCPAAVWKRLVEEGRKRDLEHGRGEPFLSDYNYFRKDNYPQIAFRKSSMISKWQESSYLILW